MHITNYILVDEPLGLDARHLRHLRMRNQLLGHGYFARFTNKTELFRDLLLSSLRKGRAAVMQILIPATIIQALILAVTISYFFVPATQATFQAIANMRSTMGISFAFLSMSGIAIFAECIRRLSSKNWQGFTGAATFGFIVFGFLGLMTDTFYQLQNWLWADMQPGTQVVAKVLMDQFVYTVLLANPYQTFLCVFKDCGFSRHNFLLRIRPLKLFYVREVLAVLITNWAFWIPMTTIIYSLPLDIQFITSRLAVIIWLLLLMTITKKS
jgi:hypothetical protein